VSGNPDFARLVAQHRSQVLRICQAILRDHHLSADASQETFLRLWRQQQAATLPEKAGPWLRRVAVRVALDVARGRSQPQHAAQDLTDETVDSRTGDPLQAVAQKELRQRLDEGLQGLSSQQRTIFVLRHEGGLKLREVAEALNLSLPAVKTQFARACWKLQSHLVATPSAKDPS
jgi:RNA polymerase sigma-70 factor (ECF subfamily)